MPDLSVFDLTGKKALVTGGSMGIGRACAIALAKGGADVAIIARHKDKGNTVVEKIRAMGRDAFFIQCDVSDKLQVQSMTEAVVARFGRLDIAVNNAGIGGSQVPDEEQDQDNWDRVIAVNLTGVWLCAQAQAQQMIKQVPTEGKIINVGSVAAITATTDGAYSASKAGVVHMTRVLAARWGRYNINVNSFCPGNVMTRATSFLPVDVRQKFRQLTPLGHVPRPQDFQGALHGGNI